MYTVHSSHRLITQAMNTSHHFHQSNYTGHEYFTPLPSICKPHINLQSTWPKIRTYGQHNTQKNVQSTISTKRGTETSAVLTVIIGMCETKILKKG
jgi:hypothetical protein